MNDVYDAGIELARLRSGLLRDAEIKKLCSGAVRRFTRMLMLLGTEESEVLELVKSVYAGDNPHK